MICATLVITVFLDGHVLPPGERVHYQLVDDALLDGDGQVRAWMDAVDGRCVDRASLARAEAYDRLAEWLGWQAREGRVLEAWDGQVPRDLWARAVTRVVTVTALAEGDAAFAMEDSESGESADDGGMDADDVTALVTVGLGGLALR